MKQAKQQAQDLRQTDTFLTTVVKSGHHPEKEKAKHSENHHPRQMNGRPKMPRVDSFSRFSDPPAPPPQQPLPEKPDAVPRNGVDAMSPLKRNDTEKPKIGSANSPVSRESSQILSLIEALSSAKRELESQGARVKELETLLLHERHARESAEEKARSTEPYPLTNGDETESTITIAPPPGSSHEDEMEQPELEKSLPAGTSNSTSDSTFQKSDESAEVQNKQLQYRLDEVMKEMEDMRNQVATYKERAESAESETVETRKSLAEMIESLRRERTENGEVVSPKGKSHQPTKPGEITDEAKGSTTPLISKDGQVTWPVPKSPQMKEVDGASAAFTTQQQKNNTLEQSSPYASMLGVVLLGVGLMAYLNGWQRMDK